MTKNFSFEYGSPVLFSENLLIIARDSWNRLIAYFSSKLTATRKLRQFKNKKELLIPKKTGLSEFYGNKKKWFVTISRIARGEH